MRLLRHTVPLFLPIFPLPFRLGRLFVLSHFPDGVRLVVPLLAHAAAAPHIPFSVLLTCSTAFG